MSNNNIQVIIRPRALNQKEIDENSEISIDFYEENTQKLTLKQDPSKEFLYDYIMQPDATQEEVFQKFGVPLTQNCIDGFNECIFAYGQTGAGKTHTMLGYYDEFPNKLAGIMPRVIQFLFAKITQIQRSVVVRCSFLEIYNETIYDLFNRKKDQLQIREDLTRGTFIQGLTEEHIETVEEAFKLINKGSSQRHVASTQMNRTSSRSHSVFCITLESKEKKDDIEILRLAKLNFVDLAGSERQKSAGTTGQRLKEGASINKSLTVLGNVISSLVEAARGSSLHIPYRDSKLTYLLKDSLGGNSKTYMIAAISIANTQFQETLSTLKFAQRVKLIQNKAQANEIVSGNQIKRLQQEIDSLKEQLRTQVQPVIGPDQTKNQLMLLIEDIRKQVPCYAKQEVMESEINWKQLQEQLNRIEKFESGGKSEEFVEQIQELNETIEILQKRLQTRTFEQSDEYEQEKSDIIQKRQIESYEDEITNLRNQINRYQKQIGERIEKEQSQKLQIMQQQDEIRMIKKRKEEIERQLKDNQEMHDTLIMQCQKQGESQLALMASQNNQLLEEIEILNATNQHQINEMLKQQESIRILEQNLNDAQYELVDIKVKAEQEGNQKEQQLKEEIEQLKEYMKQSIQENEQLNGFIDQFHNQVSEIKEQNSILEEANSQLQKQIEEQDKTNMELQQEKDQLKEQYQEIQSLYKEERLQQKQLKEDREQWKLKIQLMEEELKEYRTKTEELEGQVEVANADKMQYDSERMFEEKYIIQLKQEIENIQYLLQQNEQDREVYIQMIKKFVKTLQKEEGNQSVQISKDVNLEQLWRSIHLQIEDFNTRRCASKQAKQKLKQQIDITNENNEKLNQSIKQYKQEHQYYKQKYESCISNLEDQQQVSRQLEEENHKLKKEKNIMMNEKNSEIQMVKQLRDALQVENKDLKEQSKMINQQLKALQIDYQYATDKQAEAISKLSECIAEKIRSQQLNPYQQKLFLEANQFKQRQPIKMINFIEIIIVIPIDQSTILFIRWN